MSNTSLLGSYGDNSGSSLMFRNRIINGGMDIWQRGDNTTGSGYFADRWVVISGVTTAVENATGSPVGFRRNALITRNVSGSVIIAQRIEARNCYDLVGQSVTVTFYHVSNAGQIDSIKVGLKYANTEDTFSATTLIQEVTLSSSATGWKTVTFNALPSQAANGLQLEFTYAVTGSSSVRLTGVQFEAGPVATPFERRPIGVETALCQRYCALVASNNVIGAAQATSATGAYINFPLPTSMRATPAISFLSGTFANCALIGGGGAQTTLNGNPSIASCVGNFAQGSATTASGLTTGQMYQFIVNAATLVISAEL